MTFYAFYARKHQKKMVFNIHELQGSFLKY